MYSAAIYVIESSQLPWYRDAVTLATLVIAIATVAYVVVSFLLWTATRNSTNLTRTMYEAGNRPYAGIEELETQKASDSRSLHSLQVNAKCKNFGNVPGRNIVATIKRVVDGYASTPPETVLTAALLMPGHELGFFKELLPKNHILPIEDLKLSLSLELTYAGSSNQQYYFREEYIFEPRVGFVLVNTDGN